MIQPIQTENTTMYNPVVSSSKTKTEDLLNSQNETNFAATSSQGDTLTISSVGSQKAAEVSTAESTASSSTFTAAQSSTTKVTDILVKTTSDGEITVSKNTDATGASTVSSESEATSSSSSSTNLSSCSEADLKEMLQNGEITQAEYNLEMQRRQENNSTNTNTLEDKLQTSKANETNT